MTGRSARAAGSCRCPCGVLLALLQNDTLHLKYKELSAVVRGEADGRCRRCGHLATIASAQ